MNTIQRSGIIASWALSQQDRLYVVISNDKGHELLYIETPEMAGTLSPNRESMLRVFTSKEEAQWYLDTIAEYMGGSFVVRQTSMEELFADAEKLNENILKNNNGTLRIELCKMPSPSEFAREVDTMWSPKMLRH
jgi:hypothetical protein